MRDKERRKSTFSCIERFPYMELNPISLIKQWFLSIKYCYQRIRYGYCDRDVWSIDWWFLNVVPNMLNDLKESSQGYPRKLEAELQELPLSDESEEKYEAGMKLWRDTLSEMIYLFEEANDRTNGRRDTDSTFEYHNSCKDKGLELFKEWFWNLWD